MHFNDYKYIVLVGYLIVGAQSKDFCFSRSCSVYDTLLRGNKARESHYLDCKYALNCNIDPCLKCCNLLKYRNIVASC